MQQPETQEEAERRETIEELFDLLIVAQEMGRRLANETHEEFYAQVQELNELLHRARLKLGQIRQETRLL